MDYAPTARGLAGAEKRLYELNMNQGEMSVQRQVMQFRVDYLSDLNTQSVLMAGVAAGMLGSLELEAMQPEEEDLQTAGRMLLCAGYVLAACTSLGASVWVLYTSNNLINSALIAQLYGSKLEDLQNAESVLALRMLDVRKMCVACTIAEAGSFNSTAAPASNKPLLHVLSSARQHCRLPRRCLPHPPLSRPPAALVSRSRPLELRRNARWLTCWNV